MAEPSLQSVEKHADPTLKLQKSSLTTAQFKVGAKTVAKMVGATLEDR